MRWYEPSPTFQKENKIAKITQKMIKTTYIIISNDFFFDIGKYWLYDMTSPLIDLLLNWFKWVDWEFSFTYEPFYTILLKSRKHRLNNQRLKYKIVYRKIKNPYQFFEY